MTALTRQEAARMVAEGAIRNLLQTDAGLDAAVELLLDVSMKGELENSYTEFRRLLVERIRAANNS